MTRLARSILILSLAILPDCSLEPASNPDAAASPDDLAVVYRSTDGCDPWEMIDPRARRYGCFSGPGTCCCPGQCIVDYCCDNRCSALKGREGLSCNDKGFSCEFSGRATLEVWICDAKGVVHCTQGCSDGGM